MKNKYLKRTFLLVFSVACLSGCGDKNEPVPSKSKVDDKVVVEKQKLSLEIKEVPLTYVEPIKLTEIKKPELLNSQDDLSSFFDYSVFYGKDNNFFYTSLNEDYKESFKNDYEGIIKKAGQYGTLSHNFLNYFDDSRLNEGFIGASGLFDNYAVKSHVTPKYDFSNFNYNYYVDILSKDINRGYSLQDFSLWKDNKGLVEVNNSEQLFYTVSQGYFPYINKENKSLTKMFSTSLGILNRILEEGLSDYEKYERIYTYMTNNVLYDYDALMKEPNGSPHTEYSCYFLDGVFNDHLAVCDGLTKAMVLFCGLEGIPSYHVGGVAYSGGDAYRGHAYNYTKMFDTYYLSCVTNGSKKVTYKNKNFITHTYQYFLASYKPSIEWDYQSNCQEKIGEEVKKNKTYNYWGNKYLQLDNEKLSLDVKNFEDASKILNHVQKVAVDNKVPLEIEFLTDVRTLRELNNKLTFNCFSYCGTNGFYESEGNKKIIANYTFDGGNMNETK